MDEFGIETRERCPPELGGSELMPSAHARSDEPQAKTSSTQDVEAGATSLAARPGAPPAPARQGRRRRRLLGLGIALGRAAKKVFFFARGQSGTGDIDLRSCFAGAALTVGDHLVAGTRWLESGEDFHHFFRNRGARAPQKPRAREARAGLLWGPSVHSHRVAPDRGPRETVN